MDLSPLSDTPPRGGPSEQATTAGHGSQHTRFDFTGAPGEPGLNNAAVRRRGPSPLRSSPTTGRQPMSEKADLIPRSPRADRLAGARGQRPYRGSSPAVSRKYRAAGPSSLASRESRAKSAAEMTRIAGSRTKP